MATLCGKHRRCVDFRVASTKCLQGQDCKKPSYGFFVTSSLILTSISISVSIFVFRHHVQAVVVLAGVVWFTNVPLPGFVKG
jgi:hypothetical protein